MTRQNNLSGRTLLLFSPSRLSAAGTLLICSHQKNKHSPKSAALPCFEFLFVLYSLFCAVSLAVGKGCERTREIRWVLHNPLALHSGLSVEPCSKAVPPRGKRPWSPQVTPLVVFPCIWLQATAKENTRSCQSCQVPADLSLVFCF